MSSTVNVIQDDMPLLFGKLSKAEVFATVPPGTFSPAVKSWDAIYQAMAHLPDEVKDLIHQANNRKKNRSLQKRREIRQQEGHCVVQVVDDSSELDGEERRDMTKFMQLPSEQERRTCIQLFIDATSNKALAMFICVVCAREFLTANGALVYHDMFY